MCRSFLRVAVVASMCWASVALGQASLGTGFTYQGQIKENGVPVTTATGSFRVALYDAETGGNQVGSSVDVGHVTVNNGLFTIPLDFGSGAFNGDARWLNISVYKNGTGWVALTPRQKLTAAPYTLHALNAAGLTLPYQGTYAGDEGDQVFHVTCASQGGYAVVGETTGDESTGVYGLAAAATGTTYGVYGQAVSAAGYGGYFTGRGYFSGNLGLGVTTPAAPLDIAGGNWDLVGTEGDLRIGSSSYRLKLGVATSGGSAGLARLRAQGITGTPKIVLGAGSFDTLTVTSTNVGVGTLAPDSGAKLDVAGKIKGTGLQVTTGATNGYVLTSDASGNATWQAPSGGGELLWATGTAGAIYYNGGDVGIGTATPDADLHVATSSAVRGLHVTGAVSAIIGEGSNYGVRGEGGNYGVYGLGTSYGVRGYCAGAGKGVEAESVNGVGARITGGGAGTAFPALHVLANNAAGIGIFSVSTSTDANIVLANKGAGDIIKGFSGPTGGDLVFRVENNGKTSVSVLQITGGSDLSEQFDIGAAGTETQPGMVVCIDPENPGKLVVSTRAYDHTVAGVISGAGGVKPGMLMGQRDTVADGQHPVALTGRAYAWVDASYGAIEPGDLLTTSATPGHAMKAADYDRSRGAALGKAMSRLESGRGLVLMLVQPQ